VHIFRARKLVTFGNVLMTKQRAVKIPPDVNEAIHGAIARAIMQGRLEAGTRLPEHRLAAIFGVSRERIRKVLHRLAAERRLELSLNRGARVPCPTIDDVKRIYEAHRVLEVGVLTQLIEIVDRGLFARLDAHLAAERAAAEQHDRAESVRLSGAFHLHLVDALANPELSRFLRDLLSRSSVMVSVYEPASQSICAVDEHGAIVEALREKNLAQAIGLSRHHFLRVERRLRLGPAREITIDLESVLVGAHLPDLQAKAPTTKPSPHIRAPRDPC
jgi:DNA-binding GntR family transcriptional regulator